MSRTSSTFGRPDYSTKEPTSYKERIYSTGVNNGRNSRSSNTTMKDICQKHSGKHSPSVVALEQEYIKSLQQQIYVLELENNHLRQQTMKAVDMQPSLNTEAASMTAKLQTMQNRVDQLQFEVDSKERDIQTLNTVMSELNARLNQETDSHMLDRGKIAEDLFSLQESRDQLSREITVRDREILELKEKYGQELEELRMSDTRVNALRGELESQLDRANAVDHALAEKKSELLRLEARLRVGEERYRSNTQRITDVAKKELQDEVNQLRTKIAEVEDNIREGRSLSDKLTRDSDRLLEENAHLQRQIRDVEDGMHNARGNTQSRGTARTSELVELAALKNREKEMQEEVRRTKLSLEAERTRAKRLIHQVSKHEQITSAHAVEADMTAKRMVESEYTQRRMREENAKLEADKEKLIGDIKDLQAKIRARTEDEENARETVRSMETRLVELERLLQLEDRMNSSQWQELEKIAHRLKTHAHEMAVTSAPQFETTHLMSKSKVE